MDFGSVAVAHRSAAVTRHPSPSQGQTGCGFALARRVTGPLSGGPNVENGMDRAQKTEAVAELNRTFNEVGVVVVTRNRSEEHTSELQSLMRISYAVFCLKKKKNTKNKELKQFPVTIQ